MGGRADCWGVVSGVLEEVMLNEYDTFSIFDWHHVLTPVTIDTESSGYYRAVYVFGFRVARWYLR